MFLDNNFAISSQCLEIARKELSSLFRLNATKPKDYWYMFMRPVIAKFMPNRYNFYRQYVTLLQLQLLITIKDWKGLFALSKHLENDQLMEYLSAHSRCALQRLLFDEIQLLLHQFSTGPITQNSKDFEDEMAMLFRATEYLRQTTYPRPPQNSSQVQQDIYLIAFYFYRMALKDPILIEMLKEKGLSFDQTCNPHCFHVSEEKFNQDCLQHFLVNGQHLENVNRFFNSWSALLSKKRKRKSKPDDVRSVMRKVEEFEQPVTPLLIEEDTCKHTSPSQFMEDETKQSGENENHFQTSKDVKNQTSDERTLVHFEETWSSEASHLCSPVQLPDLFE
jgi:hypothetical protein